MSRLLDQKIVSFIRSRPSRLSDFFCTFKTSIKQVWKYAKRDGSSAWGGIVKWALGEAFEDDDIILKNLKELPLEQVDWKVNNYRAIKNICPINRR